MEFLCIKNAGSPEMVKTSKGRDFEMSPWNLEIF